MRKLAGHFHVRVDMRQIGVARWGFVWWVAWGHCGQELCCKRLGGEFSPVSIRMAKEQNLSLNPQKISGCCGRLMCCLRYEYETYKEVNSRAPKHGAKVEVPGGVARVTEINVPLERVTLQLEDGKSIKVPLAEMEYNGEGKRPTGVSEEVFEKYASPDPLDVFGTTAFEVASFSGNEKLADNESRKAAKANAKRKTPIASPAAVVVRSGSSGTEGQSANKGEGSQDQKKSASQKKERGSVAPFAPWLRQGKQAPAAGQAGSAEPARRRAQEKQFRPGCKASRP